MRAILLLLLASASAAAQPVNLSGQWKLSLADQPGPDQPSHAPPDVDDSRWPTVTLPQRTPRNERIYWLRRTVQAPAHTQAGPLQVTVGLVAESYEIYVNGVRIGDTGDFGKPEVGFFQPRSFRVPSEAVTPGRTFVIALRIWNPGARRGSLTNGLRDRGPYWITGCGWLYVGCALISVPRGSREEISVVNPAPAEGSSRCRLSRLAHVPQPRHATASGDQYAE
jgi:hypothetical protein